MTCENDNRIVLTLDAGGTNFVFAAIQGGKRVGESMTLPSEAKDLDASINNIKAGFNWLINNLDSKPSAISFAFPGPADYPKGIIYNVGNLPAYTGGVALADILKDTFKIPVFINNDGDLFTYGEAIAGLLPSVNDALAQAGSTKRYKNLFGITLGTGLGGGLAINGELYIGDNSNAAEVWLLRNKLYAESFAEEGACIRAIQKGYAKRTGIKSHVEFQPNEIAEIARQIREGNTQAALDSYKEMGEILGDVLSSITTLLDPLIVIGGGLSKSADLFMDSVITEMNSTIKNYDGKEFSRLAQVAYNLQDKEEFAEFIKGGEKEIDVYGTNKKVVYDPLKRTGVGITKLGTSEAISLGAYAFALRQIDQST